MSEYRFVWLRNGAVLPLEAVELGLRLEGEGYRFRVDGAGRLLVAPFDQLCADDRAALRRWRWHLTMLLTAPVVDDRQATSGHALDATEACHRA